MVFAIVAGSEETPALRTGSDGKLSFGIVAALLTSTMLTKLFRAREFERTEIASEVDWRDMRDDGWGGQRLCDGTRGDRKRLGA